ncbi:hypothetical protein, partial [Pseudomonas sp. NFACC13-1]|uniref:hypothetical protein n=1 Tax=Pseudomonas sp. NFACC13-1 TaxID=1566245 RepID=UPI001C40ACD2
MSPVQLFYARQVADRSRSLPAQSLNGTPFSADTLMSPGFSSVSACGNGSQCASRHSQTKRLLKSLERCWLVAIICAPRG